MTQIKRSVLFVILLACFCTGGISGRSPLKIEYPGKIVDCQGIAALQPPSQERWTPLAQGMFVDRGDLIRTDPRGANAVQVRLAGGGGFITGPNSLVQLVNPASLKIDRGEVEITAPDKQTLTVGLPGGKTETIRGTVVIRATEGRYEMLKNEPAWLKYFKGTLAKEPMGSLLATVEGRNLPLTLGYHKVTVDIRDQIARTTIEESFVNNTEGTLEGVFHFPLPQDASISGFGMWIGDELVEADVVEKQRAREIYETILRERRDPGLLEWSGGNIFKARVFPIFAHSEKRIKITYTQVLPMENGKYRYSYALQSEMLKQFPLRELAVTVRLSSQQPLKAVTCPSHDTRLTQAKNSAQVEFSAKEYTPSKDFEVQVEIGQSPEIVVIPHRRGEDGYFLLQVAQPDSGRGGKRALINDGPPLDVCVMADTSASMDKQQRKLQDEFIATLAGALGKNDHLRVFAVDMDCHWISASNLDSVRDFLSHRASLGTTDLEKVFGKVFAVAGETTQIIYLGDCVDTTREADPVETAQRLKRLYAAKGKGTVHVVATGSSFESGVMKALASASGGSTRRLQGNTPARTGVMDLLEEMTRPGIRDMKVEFSGVKVARVYPAELPNLPAGRQQIVLGRYLPAGSDQSGKVTVTGTFKGKPVKYSAPFTVKDAESGNSFIPRLWARLHLDMLLEQGSSETIKDEVIALSEEYHIMTPYTSFLVLESDADRERFKVTRRVTMRDGEKFFAEGRDKAGTELRQKYMKVAGKWRQDLRRTILDELLELGRQDYAQLAPAYDMWDGRVFAPGSFMASGKGDKYGMGSSYNGRILRMDARVNSIDDLDSFGVGSEVDGGGKSGGGSDGDSFFDDISEAKQTAADEPGRPMPMEDFEPLMEMEAKEILWAAPATTAPSQRLLRAEKANISMNWSSGYTAALQIRSPVLMKGLYAQRRLGAGKPGRGYYDDRAWQPYWNSWIEQLFPPVPDPPATPSLRTPPPQKKSDWPEAIKALSESLLRQPALDDMTDALELIMDTTVFDDQGKVSGKASVNTLYSPASWISRLQESGGRSRIDWSDGKARAAFLPCFQLGRQRAFVESDRKLLMSYSPPFTDYSLTSLEDSYPGYTPTLTDQGAGTVLLSLANTNVNNDYSIEILVDTTRKVVLETRSRWRGALASTVIFSDFVKAGGSWWARRIEIKDKTGAISQQATLKVREISKMEYGKAFAAMTPATKNAIMIPHPLPDYAAARQAKQDNKMELAHYLTMISFYSQTSQLEKAREIWNTASSLTAGRAGGSWINLAVMLQTRRHEEAKQDILAKAKQVAGGGQSDELSIANLLYSYLQSMGQQNEQLDFLDSIRPVYERQEKYLHSDTTWKRNHAQALSQVGRRGEALAVWKELTRQLPQDTGLAINYVSALIEDNQLEEAYAWLTGQLHQTGLWNQQKRNSIRLSVIGQLENRIDTDKWLEFLAEWTREGSAHQAAYKKYLEALYRMQQTEEAHRLIEKWTAAGVALLKEEAAQKRKIQEYGEESEARQNIMAQMQAALEQILGQHNYYSRTTLDKRWHPLLAGIVRDSYRVESLVSVTSQIMQHHLFSQLPEAAELRKEFKKTLLSEFDTLSPALIAQLSNWIASNDPKVEKEEWAGLAVKLESLWDSGKLTVENRALIATTLVSVLDRAQDPEGITRFLRKQWKNGPEIHKRTYLTSLYLNLLEKPWTQANETELFTLFREFGTGTEPEETRRLAMIQALMDTVDAMIKVRTAASLETVKGKEDLSRIEYRKLVAAHEKTAREGMVKRLESELSTQDPALGPWLKIERLYLEMKLGREAKPIAAACWSLMPPAPPVTKPGKHGEADLVLATLESKLMDRCLATLSCLAAKQSADPALVGQFLAFVDKGIELNPHEPYWRQQKYRLLVARNEPKPLEEALRGWISPDNADDTWRLALGYLLAELDRVDDAVKLFEQIEKNDGLGSRDYAIMAGWYLVLDQKEKHEEALLKELMVVDEYELDNRLQRLLSPWYRNTLNVPEELDPVTFKIFTALFRKSVRPENYVYRLREFYRYTKDFRLLECMSEGMLGHTAEQVYPYAGGLRGLLGNVREEASVDSALAHLAKVRARAKTRVDERALDILEMLLCRRAAEVGNQPGPHIEKALAAMQRAFKGDWQTGERRLMASLLRELGKMSSEALRDEQLRELKELAGCRTEPEQDRMNIAVEYAVMLYEYSRKTEAIDLLEATLAEHRNLNHGFLAASANVALETFISQLEGMGQFSRAESFLAHEQANPLNAQQHYFFIQRMLRLYNNAIGVKATVSFGSGQPVFEKVLDLYISELARSDQNHRNQVFSRVTEFFRTSKTAALDVSRMRAFAFESFPGLIRKETNPYNYQNQVQSLGSALRDVLDARTALEFLIMMLETEPDWLRFQSYSGWSQQSYQLGQYRSEAKDIGALAERLLKIVLKELRRDLEFREPRNRTLYSLNHYFWEEKTDAFLAVAEDVWRAQTNSGAAALHISGYLWDGLAKRERAAGLLREAYHQDLLDEGGKAQYVNRLHELGRYEESVPVLEGLVIQNPDQVTYRAQLMTACFHTSRQELLDQTLAGADKYFHQPGKWQEGVVYTLAKGCLDVKYFREAAAYYNEVIAIHKRSQPRNETGNGQLSQYYRELSHAYTGLKMTAEAVDAASGAVVTWGETHRNRADALQALEAVVKDAPDLDSYVKHLEAEAEKTGLENPILRKAVAKAYLARGQTAEAVRHFKIALETQPNDRETHEALVAAYDKLGDKAGATACLLDAVELSRRDIALYRSLGDRYVTQLKNEVEAERAYASIVEMLPSESESHTLLAEIRQTQGRWDEAIHHWRQVGRIRSLEPTGYLKLAQAQIQGKKFDDARDTLRKLEKRDWPERFGNIPDQVRELRGRIP